MAKAPRWLSPLLDHPLRRRILVAVDERDCRLVGGAIRDLHVFGDTARDWDLIVDDAPGVATRLAEVLGGTAVHLGGERFDLHRVVAPSIRIDLQAPLESTLEGELSRRDLTVNAIALELAGGTLEDPLDGAGDLDRALLRQCGPSSFGDDPLRVLRLVRFASSLPGFAVDPATLESARREAARLGTVAPERIREELGRILSGRAPVDLGSLLESLRLFPALWSGGARPRGRPRLGELERCLRRALRTAGRTARPEELEAVRHAALLVAAAAPGAVPSSAVLVENGYVSAALARRVDRLLAPVPRPTDEAARRRYLSRLGQLWPLAAALRLWEADEDPEPWIGTITALAATAADAGDELFDARSPLDGDELQRLFGLAPGPELGRLIEGLRNARIEGRIETRTQAIDWARRWIATSERRRPAD